MIIFFVLSPSMLDLVFFSISPSSIVNYLWTDLRKFNMLMELTVSSSSVLIRDCGYPSGGGCIPRYYISMSLKSC